MNNLLTSNSLSSIENLNLQLLSTLDEATFYCILIKHFRDHGMSAIFDCYLIENQNLLKSIILNDEATKEKTTVKLSGVMNMVSKNRSVYFSNNTSDDPLFVNFNNDLLFNKQMCIPLIVDGVVFGIINAKRKNDQPDFSQTQIIDILSTLKTVTQPISNLVMFLEAKRLNTVLQKKIEAQDSNANANANDKSFQNSNDSEKIFKLVLRSKAMQRAKVLADKLSQSSMSFTVEGEIGSGKEFMARYITDKSSRKESPFVIFDASSVDPILADVLLFGARREGMPLKEGLIFKANNGSLLIKNVFLLPENVQRKLLNVIKENAFTRSGEEQFRKVDVRIIVSTREPLSKSFEEGRLIQDFFYQIARVTLNIPSLIDRIEDIDQLATLFLNQGREIDQQKSFSPAVLNNFKSYNWPGNVRELSNLAERTFLLSDGSIIEKSGLESKIAQKEELSTKSKNDLDSLENFIQTSLEEVEKVHICKTLKHLSGNKTKTAKALGITVKTLYNKLHTYNLIEEKK